LRLFLDQQGFRIEQEALCRDGRNIHCVLRARWTGNGKRSGSRLKKAYAGPCVLGRLKREPSAMDDVASGQCDNYG
jgi:tRNA A22 N-methylase